MMLTDFYPNMKYKKRRKTKHHIQPKSRGGTSNLENICRVAGKEHERYHHLFGNRTPYEILDYLTNTFWNKNPNYILQYAESLPLRSAGEIYPAQQETDLDK